MADKDMKSMIGEVFNEIADALETGSFGKSPVIGITTLGSEHGMDNIIQGALEASGKGDVEVVLIGPENESKLKTYVAETEDEAHKVMEKLIDEATIDGAVTMHYSFPIGVSTVGRVVTPGLGREMYIATTTGTSSTDRISGMIKNAVYGIISARACGVENPKVGILNVDGARQTEKALKELAGNGYDIEFVESARADGGIVMRGNDLIKGTPDVMVTDPLTGNLLMKMFSSFLTGGSYEALGYGYGPGIGDGYDRRVLILSRASGSKVVAGAIRYAGELTRGKSIEVSRNEFNKARAAGLDKILDNIHSSKKEVTEEVKRPDKEIVTSQLSGIEIMDLEDAVNILWQNDIYAESGMGCTGPIILVNESKREASLSILAENDFIS